MTEEKTPEGRQNLFIATYHDDNGAVVVGYSLSLEGAKKLILDEMREWQEWQNDGIARHDETYDVEAFASDNESEVLQVPLDHRDSDNDLLDDADVVWTPKGRLGVKGGSPKDTVEADDADDDV